MINQKHKYHFEIETHENIYYDCIYSIAERIRKECIIPFCDKKKLGFVSGMGGYNFRKSNGEIYPNENLPKTIKEILDKDIINGQVIGSMMEDYLK
jgi:hypothetical protein